MKTNKSSERRPRTRTQDLQRRASEFDREFVADTFREPAPADRTRWARARRKRGRPRKGQGAKAISVSLEHSLLERTDRLARDLGLTRSDLIARALRAALVLEEAEP